MKREVPDIPLQYKDGYPYDPNISRCKSGKMKGLVTSKSDINDNEELGAYYCPECEKSSQYRCYFTYTRNLQAHLEVVHRG